MGILKCAAIFTDHMVLQRNKNIKVWGNARSFCNVTAAINGNSVTSYVKDNEWICTLPPMSAGGPYEMVVSDDLGNSLSFKDIMIGEVWMAGGQSNMEFELHSADGGEDAIKSAKDVNVRFYYTKKIPYIDEFFYLDERDNSWTKTDDEQAMRCWSAVGYFYAKKLSEELGVTVGVIGCNWGGTSASAWMSRKMLSTDVDTNTYLEEYDKAMEGKSFEDYLLELDDYFKWHSVWQPKIDEFFSKNPEGSWSEAQEFAGPSRWPDPMGPKSPYRPAGLYETMVKRVNPYALAGFIYYQGESDDHKNTTYYKLLKKLIEQWRNDWEDDSLPFYIVQLPMHIERGETDRKHWCKIREAQYRVHKTTANTGLAVILDCGLYGNIHPTDKKPVGERLALQSLCHTYKMLDETKAYGGFYKAHTYENGRMMLEFDYINDGFEVKGDKITLFEIAGDDKKFVTANAEIIGNKIFIKSDEVSNPVYARYNWTNFGEVVLFSKTTGIPLAPFRTSMNDE